MFLAQFKAPAVTAILLSFAVGSTWANAPHETHAIERGEVLRATQVVAGKAALHAGGYVEAGGADDHVDDATRAEIWRGIDANLERLGLKRKIVSKVGGPGLAWPLRPAPGFPYPNYYIISNYVDHDAAFPGKLRDFTCQARTYDTDAGYNHKGVDIAMGPDGWNIMAAKGVHIVAAAPGIIVQKHDGHFDRNCKANSKQWNAVYLRHDDGSFTWYGHMKLGSLTTKPVGARVEEGEYLGAVGSSGNSSGPHLHFEVYDAAQKLIDPYAGTCNALNSESWWKTQPAYRETAVTRLNLGMAPPVFSQCGADGTLAKAPELNARTVFTPGETVYFSAFFRDQLNTSASNYRVLRPDGTVWQAWTHTPPAEHYISAAWYWAQQIEATAPSGIWTFEVSYMGATHTQQFQVRPAALNRNYAGIWWNADEAGWGISLSHQGDVLAAAWFSYDSTERDMWALLPGAARVSDGTYSGALVRPTGTPFNAVPFAADDPAPVVGTMSFTFSSQDAGTVSYTLDGRSITRPIQRLLHGETQGCGFWHGTRKMALNYQDTWWSPSESGWGLFLSHQGSSLTGAMYTYDQDRKGLWMLLQNVTRGGDGAFQGDLMRFTGRPFHSVPFTVDAPIKAGTVRIDFESGDKGTLDFTIYGSRSVKPIERLVFTSPVALCR
jgi:murein DD-endopeptidase MepM/ murein hydrolase activator NlpD